MDGLLVARDGMIQVYTGKGKGKTTASIGLGIRAVGSGKKVLMIQFLKSPESSELNTLEEVKNFDFKCFGREGIIKPEDINEEDSKIIKEGLDFLEKNFENYDVIILDEINVVLKMGLIKTKKILDIIKKLGQREIILTGRGAPKEIKKVADLVTNFKEEKHYFHKGKEAREGIEF